jgi:hypothetical protein
MGVNLSARPNTNERVAFGYKPASSAVALVLKRLPEAVQAFEAADGTG